MLAHNFEESILNILYKCQLSQIESNELWITVQLGCKLTHYKFQRKEFSTENMSAFHSLSVTSGKWRHVLLLFFVATYLLLVSGVTTARTIQVAVAVGVYFRNCCCCNSNCHSCRWRSLMAGSVGGGWLGGVESAGKQQKHTICILHNFAIGTQQCCRQKDNTHWTQFHIHSSLQPPTPSARTLLPLFWHCQSKVPHTYIYTKTHICMYIYVCLRANECKNALCPLDGVKRCLLAFAATSVATSPLHCWQRCCKYTQEHTCTCFSLFT